MELKQLSKLKNHSTALLLGSGGFYFGYYVAIFNPLFFPMLTGSFGYDKTKDENLLNTYFGLVNLFFCLGAMIGVLVSGYLSDKFGRRPILYSGEIIALIGLVPSIFAHIAPLLISRIINGVVTGINSSMFSVIMAEMLPNKVCGFGNSFSYMAITIGILMAYLTLNIFSFDTLRDYWRIFVLWPLAVSVTRLVLFPFLIRSETQKYVFNKYSDKGREECFKKVLEVNAMIYETQSAELVTKDMIEVFEKQKLSGNVTLKKLLSKEYRKRLFSGALVSYVQQFAGISFLIFYSTVIFDEIKDGYGKTMGLMIGISNFVGSILTIYLIQKKGRKFNLVTGAAINVVSLIILLIGYSTSTLWLLILACIVFMLSFAVGLGGTLTAYISEVLPPLGVGISLSLLWFLNGLLGFVLPPLIKQIGAPPIIAFLAGITFINIFILDCFLIETKGKTEAMVIDEFRNRKYKFMDIFRSSKMEPVRVETSPQEIITERNNLKITEGDIGPDQKITILSRAL